LNLSGIKFDCLKNNPYIVAMIIRANAKINLGLRILEKRPDGYHNIVTMFQEISLHDTLTISRRTDDQITISGDVPDMPLDRTNIVWQAFEKFQEKTGIYGGIDVKIAKKIPIGGGLGGGSSNAAALLKAVNELWDVNLDIKELAEIGESIGSDVPFLLLGGTMLGEGKGEKLTRFSLATDYYILLVCPGIHISTPWAYKHAKIILTKLDKFTTFHSVFFGLRTDVWKKGLINDFEAVVFSEYPELAGIKKRMYDAGAFYAGMSGSGSTMYGLFTTRAEAEKTSVLFSDEGRYYFISKPVSR